MYMHVFDDEINQTKLTEVQKRWLRFWYSGELASLSVGVKISLVILIEPSNVSAMNNFKKNSWKCITPHMT
mgnify:CR=1 FL=1